MNPFIERRLHIQSVSTLCSKIIKPNNKIKLIAENIVKDSNAENKDSLHLASAIYSNCDYFITCDDKFIKTIENNTDKLKNVVGKTVIYNPIDFLRKEMDINVIE